MEQQNYLVGNIVKHEKFCVGKVIETKGGGDNGFTIVQFEDAAIGTKSLMNKFVKLEILDSTTDFAPQPTKEEVKRQKEKKKNEIKELSDVVRVSEMETKILQQIENGYVTESDTDEILSLAKKDATKAVKNKGIISPTEDCSYYIALQNVFSEKFGKTKAPKVMTIKDKVVAAKDVLSKMTTHGELRNWAINNGMDNRSAFPKFKEALNEIDMDYDEIKNGIKKLKEAELQLKLKYQVELFVDAKASAGMYGITDKDGNVLWYGKFFPDDDAGEQSRAELAAAKKAVWLSSKIKEAIGQDAIELYLNVDAQWLIYQDHAGQKGYALTNLANKYNIKLHVQWISGKDNPADEWTTAKGYKKWQDNDLKVLPKLIDDVEQTEDVKHSEAIRSGEIQPEVAPEVDKFLNSQEIDYCEVVKETELAINLKIKIGFEIPEGGDNFVIKNTKEVEFWLPKSQSKIENNKLFIAEKFWEAKKKEVSEKEKLIIFDLFSEHDKSYGVSVRTEEYASEQEVIGKIFFPKSMSFIEQGKLIVPYWMFLSKLKEEKESHQYGAFSYVSMSTSVSEGNIYGYATPIIIPCKQDANIEKYTQIEQYSPSIEESIDNQQNKNIVSNIISDSVIDEYHKAKRDLEQGEALQKKMKDANAIIRSKKNVTERLIKEVGLSEEKALKLQQPDFAGRIGFAQYSLTNNNANIKRLRERVNMLEEKMKGAEKAASGKDEKLVFDGGYIDINYEADRVQLFFNERPIGDMYNSLKRNGWHWSPMNKAWQRKITPQAISNAKYITKATVAEIAQVEQPIDVVEESKKNDRKEIVDLQSQLTHYENQLRNIDKYPKLNAEKLEKTILEIKNQINKYQFKEGDYVEIVGLENIKMPDGSANPFQGKIGIIKHFQNDDVQVMIPNVTNGEGFLEANLKPSTKREFDYQNEINIVSEKVPKRTDFLDNLTVLDLWKQYEGGDGKWYRKFHFKKDAEPRFVRAITDLGIKERTEDDVKNGGMFITVSVSSESKADELSELYMDLFPVNGMVLRTAEDKSDYAKELKRQVNKGLIEDESKGISLYHLNEKIQSGKQNPIEIIGYDKGDNIKTIIDGQPYTFATQESHQGISVYGIAFPNEDFFTFLSRSKKAENLYNKYKVQIEKFLKEKPPVESMGTFAGQVSKETMHNAFIPNLPVKVGGYTDEEIKAHREKYATNQFKGIHHDYKNQYELNKAIELLITEKGMSNSHTDYSSDEKLFIRRYSGYGGLDKYGTTGKGGLFEYYTPREVVEKMWALAYKYGYNNGSLLEPSCFVAGTKIKTQNGLKNIEDIEIGEKVLTHKGRFLKVVDAFSKESNEQILISIPSSPTQITVTPEHPFYAVNVPKCTSNRTDRPCHKNHSGSQKPCVVRWENYMPSWVDAGKLNIGDYVLEAFSKKEQDLDFIEFPKTHPNQKEIGKVLLSENTLKLFGLFISEGCTDNHSVIFTIHEKEKELLDVIKTFCNSIGIKHTVKTKINNKSIEVKFTSILLAKWFRKEFGHRAENKKIPSWAMELPINKQKLICWGITKGDGHFNTKKRSIVIVNTVSINLAEQCKLLMYRFGIVPSIRVSKPSNTLIKDREINRFKNIYSVHASGLYYPLACDIFGIKESLNPKQSNKTGFIENNFAWIKIQNIEKQNKKVDVFNISVEKDESYTIQGATVHNCATGEFLQFAKPEIRQVGFEINEFSAIICKILYPTADIRLQPFEQHFIKNNWTVKGNVEQFEKFDLVIGNPPYGDFSIVQSRYMSGMGEKDYTQARNYVEYFIRRSMDLLKPNGLLIFIVGAQIKNGGTLFLDSGTSPVKEWLNQNSTLLDAYRLPDSIFERTGVTSEIIVIQKK